MRQIPTEVSREIFFWLHPDDQMECMLVCHRWKQIIEQFVLHHTIVINSMNSLNGFLEKIRKRPDIAKKVQRLVLYLEYEFREVNRNILLSLLPNIKTFYSAGPDSVEQVIEEKTHYPWYNNLEHISEYSPITITYQLLSSNTCPNLTFLDICDFEKNIIPYLKNAPALKYLGLGGYSTISFHDLNDIHRNLPLIQVFKITDMSFDDSGFDETAEPALSVTDFSFYRVYMKNLETRTSVLKYISKKYPKLIKLEYDVFHVIKEGDSIDNFNQHGWMPLIQNLGPQLQKLCVSHSGQVEDFIDSLEKHFCHIDFLKAGSLPHASLLRLAQSQQAHYIQTLVLENDEFQDFNWLNYLHVLKNLTLSSFGFNIQAVIEMSQVLENCPPTVNSLTFDRVTLTASLKYIVSSNIESLSFVYADMPIHIDTFISQHFPRLSYLKLENCKDIYHRIFNLATVNLSSFHCQGPFMDDDAHILVLTLCNNKRRCYSPRGYRYYIPFKELRTTYDFLMYPPIKSHLIDEMKSVPLLTIICNSLTNAYVMK